MPDGIDTHTHKGFSDWVFRYKRERKIDNGSDGNLLASDGGQGPSYPAPQSIATLRTETEK